MTGLMRDEIQKVGLSQRELLVNDEILIVAGHDQSVRSPPEASRAQYQHDRPAATLTDQAAEFLRIPYPRGQRQSVDSTLSTPTDLRLIDSDSLPANLSSDFASGAPEARLLATHPNATPTR